MADIHIEIDAGSLVAGLDRFAAKAREQLTGGLFEEAEAIMTRSKEEFVPVDTGVLRASGYVEPPVVTEEEVSVTLGFGGAARAYAAIVHERLHAHHRVGQAKYLEIPALEAAAALGEHLAKKITE